MRAHCLQHVPFEGLGSIESWLAGAGYDITWTRFFASPELPDPNAIDLLIILGGPMGVNDEDEYPWLVPEKHFIRDAIRSGTPVLGICLGAQLMATALGAKVFRNAHKEIGWFPIQAIPSTEASVFRFPASLEVFHWHGDTFDLPAGAVHLAKSDGCDNQAFQVDRSAIGLQFHLETTPDAARAIISNCREELIPSAYVQSEKEILSAPPEHYRAINNLMGDVLEYLEEKTV